ncbi:MAG TPA: hypothetical protein VFY60_05980, partial [Pyrinomonadaceae bacterium]|nr:hypothetical protein [Pyrinomonadaceae bacterium]
GSLLRAVTTGEFVVLQNLRRVCSDGALFEVVTGLDPERDQSEIERLGLTSLSLEFIDEVLSPRYEAAGFEMIERGILSPAEWPEINTSWAKRLHGSERRSITYLICRAIP